MKNNKAYISENIRAIIEDEFQRDKLYAMEDNIPETFLVNDKVVEIVVGKRNLKIARKERNNTLFFLEKYNKKLERI